jgi:ADP-heptose:LPS heptosyltransferase
MTFREKLKPITRRVAFFLEIFTAIFDCFALSRKSDHNNKTLIIFKTDAIGDYILFHNFLKYFRESEKYKDYKIVFVGNIICKPLFDSLDNSYVNEFVWLDLKLLRNNIAYRIQTIKKINIYLPEDIINVLYSRAYYVDHIIKYINAETKIAVEGDNRNILSYLKILTNKFYTRLINIPSKFSFEFLRNKYLVETIIEKQIGELQKPDLRISKPENFKIPFNGKYAVVFPDASVIYKKWSIENYIKIAEYLIKKYSLYIVFAGQNLELKYTNENVMNLIDKTNLLELSYIIKNAEILICNDTSATHIGVASNVKTICVSRVTDTGRFIPYPPEMSFNMVTIFPPVENGKQLSEINTIKIETVISEIDKMLSCR